MISQELTEIFLVLIAGAAISYTSKSALVLLVVRNIACPVLFAVVSEGCEMAIPSQLLRLVEVPEKLAYV